MAERAPIYRLAEYLTARAARCQSCRKADRRDGSLFCSDECETHAVQMQAY